MEAGHSVKIETKTSNKNPKTKNIKKIDKKYRKSEQEVYLYE